MKFDNLSIKVKNYLCFGEEESGFDSLKLFNVIIGRNNSGKSTLLEVLHYACDKKKEEVINNANKNLPTFVINTTVNNEAIERSFSKGTHNQVLGDFYAFGTRFANGTIKYEHDLAQINCELISTIPPFEVSEGSQHNDYLKGEFGRKLANAVNEKIFFSNKIFKRIFSERNILPEAESDAEILGNGAGLTINFYKYLNYSDLPSDLIEFTILGELNKIFEPDITFTNIDVQKNKVTREWEIFVSEKKKGKISLSNSGSGIKTVLIVLTFLYLLPIIEQKDIKDYIFAFEELENNLHPAIQRRLYSYLLNFAKQQECIFFLTTHSSIAIDTFSKDPDAQILHITHNNEFAKVTMAKTYIEHGSILDDLDIRASDLLQSNCIVWLEGPSDRLYFNKWVSMRSNEKIREGVHYQCVFYGGRLLAHLTAIKEEYSQENLVEILGVNKNAIMLIDSDKRSESDQLNNTKQRLINEISQSGGFAWVTEGKEIENYISKSVIEKYYDIENIEQIKKYQSFSDYLNLIKVDEGKRFLKNKVLYAEYFISSVDNERDLSVLDLEHKLEMVISKIKTWNGIT